ncbi:MAG: hypothetical protein CFE37_12195 [Alphaproteobacteria bacterium PA4]|nr:MAG: hypothetical protein CFE37_12195 [Alphaproteobacteria bacterium PA4]
MRWFGFLLLVWSALLPAAAAAAIYPRIVRQFSDPVEIAAWTPDDRFLITAMGVTRNITIWNVQDGVIVDRLAVPMPADIGQDLLTFDSIEIAPDGRRALLRGSRLDVYTENGKRRQDWQIDLLARRITPLPVATGPVPDGNMEALVSAYQGRLEALTQIYEGSTHLTEAQAVAALPALPASHDGKWRLERTADGPSVIGRNGKGRVLGLGFKPAELAHAAMSSDGQWLAMLLSNRGQGEDGSVVVLDNPQTGADMRRFERAGRYGRVQWLDDTSVLLSHDEADDSRDPADAGASDMPSPALVIDLRDGEDLFRLPPRCYVTSIAGSEGWIIGAGLANCRAIAGAAGKDRALWLAKGATAWTKIDLGLPKDVFIDAILGAPKGGQVALAMTQGEKTSLLVVDIEKGVVVNSLDTGDAGVSSMFFSDDASTLFISYAGRQIVWRPSDASANGKPLKELAIGSLMPAVMSSDGTVLAVAGMLDAQIERYVLATGRKLSPLPLGNIVAGGTLPGRNLFWAAAMDGGVRFWDKSSGQEQRTTYYFPEGGYLTVTPDGRYDTNLGADTDQFRWLMADAPWQSLGSQTFMRDSYEPRLAGRLNDCQLADNCATMLPPPNYPAEQRNRVLPRVAIESITPGPTPDVAIVTVAAAEGVNPAAPNGKTRSGLYNLRVFRDGQLVGQYPAAAADSDALADWQAANRLPVGADGRARASFTVPLATGAGHEMPVFTAYAFNSDRIKGETASRSYARPPVTPRHPRAYVIAIGIDAYTEPRFRLNYSVADARLIDARLVALPGYETRRLLLTGETGRAQANKALIAAALAILAGGDGVSAARATLAAAGIDAGAIEPATPDDAVIISFAGHGWATPQSEFYLVPADGLWPAGAPLPQTATMIATSELTRWVQPIAAGEMAIILDACHSAAIVDVPGFKPGPMGDRGLGQLAFDKGIRILTATQAANVALEDGALGHGLLTYALVRDGLEAGKAGDGSGRTSLDTWLEYGVERVPELAVEVAKGERRMRQGGARDLIDEGAPVARPRPVQRPSLFDFTGATSAVQLPAGKRNATR